VSRTQSLTRLALASLNQMDDASSVRFDPDRFHVEIFLDVLLL
jgi:hypothetical protein